MVSSWEASCEKESIVTLIDMQPGWGRGHEEKLKWIKKKQKNKQEI